VKGSDDAHRTVRRVTSRIGNHSVGRNQAHPARDRATLAAAPQMLVVARCSRQRTSLNSRSDYWTTEEPTAINVPRSEVGHRSDMGNRGVVRMLGQVGLSAVAGLSCAKRRGALSGRTKRGQPRFRRVSTSPHPRGCLGAYLHGQRAATAAGRRIGGAMAQELAWQMQRREVQLRANGEEGTRL